jgi:hypothetical protein
MSKPSDPIDGLPVVLFIAPRSISTLAKDHAISAMQ